MKVKMPLKVTLQGTEDVVVISDIWNTVKNWGFGTALIALVFLFCAYGFPALFVVLAIATAIFGCWSVFKQKTALEKIGASVILAVLIGGLLFGAWMLQKPTSSPVSAVRNVLSQTVSAVDSPSQTPVPSTTAMVTTPLPAVTVNIPIPDHLKIEVDEKEKQSADPTANMMPEERRQYEIWVLRK